VNEKEKAQIKDTIEKDILSLKEKISHLEKKVKPITPDCSIGRVSRFEMMGDQEIDLKILGEAQLRLTRLQNAFSRIHTKMFGVCIECEEDIGVERMRIRPESAKCVICSNTL